MSTIERKMGEVNLPNTAEPSDLQVFRFYIGQVTDRHDDMSVVG